MLNMPSEFEAVEMSTEEWRRARATLPNATYYRLMYVRHYWRTTLQTIHNLPSTDNNNA